MFVEFANRILTNGSTLSGTVVSPWIEVAQQFVCDHSVNPRDFRELRLRRLVVDLVKLIELLDPHKMSKEMREWQKDAPKEASSIRQIWSWWRSQKQRSL